MRTFSTGKETLNFLAMAAFFGCGLLLSKEFIPIHNMWDYVVLQVLTMMNGLGLCVVLVLWVSRVRDGRAETQGNGREKAREEEMRE